MKQIKLRQNNVPLGSKPADHGYAFTSGRTIPVPVELIDKYLPELSFSELKLLLYIARRTLGFRKLRDMISNQQFVSGLKKRNGERLDFGSGVSARRLPAVLKSLKKKHLIRTKHAEDHRGANLPTRYVLNFSPEAVSMLESTIIKKDSSKKREDAASPTTPAPMSSIPPDIVATTGTDTVSDHNMKISVNRSKKEKKRTTSPPAKAVAPLQEEDLSEIVVYWNKNKGSHMAPVEKLHRDRVEKLQQIVSLYSIDRLKHAIDNMSKSSFLNGSNDRGWVANLDFMIKDEATFVKILEGGFKEANSNKSKTKVFPEEGKYAKYN